MKNNKSQRSSAQLESVYRKYAAMDAAGVLSAFDCMEEGPNRVHSTKAVPWYVFLFKSFLDEFILVLLFLGMVSFF